MYGALWLSSRQQVHCLFVADDAATYQPHHDLLTALHETAAAKSVSLAVRVVAPQRFEQSEARTLRLLSGMHGVVMPSGFHGRGLTGKLRVARWAREQRIPYMGICLGMQVLLIEAARNLLGFATANSVEFDAETSAPIVAQMEEGGMVVRERTSLRQGYCPCEVTPGSQAYEALGKEEVDGFHSHWFECNLQFVPALEAAGVRVAGRCPEGGYAEIVEIVNHPYMLGIQFHPEHDSTFAEPHPLIARFVSKCAALKVQERSHT